MWFENFGRLFNDCFDTHWIDCWIDHDGYENSKFETSKSRSDAKKTIFQE